MSQTCAQEPERIVRKAVTQNDIAMAVATHELSPLNDMDLLYESVRGIVKGLCYQMHWFTGLEPDELEQLCAKRMLRSIGTFATANCSITTWTHITCRSVISAAITSNKRRQRHEEELLSRYKIASQVRPDESFQLDFKMAVEDLKRKYPAKTKFIEALFPPDDVPESISIPDAIFVCDMEYAEGRAFWEKIIKPFFAERFGREP